jgi:hypothetical protein
MRCYYCGNALSTSAKECPSCGRINSRLSYVHICGIIGGVVGSLIGFTAFQVEGALVGGLVGILLAELAGRLAFRPK